MPNRHISVARVGVEPTANHEGLSFAALPVCVPCRHKSVPDGIRTRGLHRDRVTRTPGSSTGTSQAPGVRIERTASWFRARRNYQQLLPRNAIAYQIGEKDSNLHKQLQRLPAYR